MEQLKVTWPQVVLFGDSHFQRGFSPDSAIASMLADKLQRRCDVLARGFSGYNSQLAKLALRSFLGDLDTKKIVAVVVLVGSNDACEKLSSPQAVSLTEYSRNLEDTIALLKSRGITPDKIILISPPPADQPAWEKHRLAQKNPVTVRHNATLEKHSMACAMVAERCSTKFVDLYGKMISSPDWKEYFWDGLHLSPKGSKVLFDSLWEVLEPVVEPCGTLLPDWKDVDPENPEKAFGPK